MDPYTLQRQIRSLVESEIQRLGHDLVAVEWTGGGGRGILRLSVDSPEGTTAGSCARISRAIEPLLDAADPIASAYTLEVSSPGIDRPVQRISDFARFAGYTVRIRLEAGPPRRRYTGAIVGVDDDDVLVECDGEEHRFHIDTIERAHLVLSVEEFLALGAATAATPAQENSDDYQ